MPHLTCPVCQRSFFRSPAQLRDVKTPPACGWKCRKILLADRVENRFWSHVRKGPNCWVWQGAKDEHGYGYFYFGPNDYRQAHRVSYLLLVTDPGENCVLHNCPGGDNPSCVNPNHLYLGTRDVNNKDKVRKEQQSKKYRREEVYFIRGNHVPGLVTVKDLARSLNLTCSIVYRIAKGITASPTH